MNILHKVALQGLKKNRTRTAVTIIGVILSAAMITAVSTFGVSLLDYMAKGAAQRYGGWHLAFLDADPSFARERALDRDVLETVSFENIGYAALEGGKNPNRPYLFIAGFNAETFDALPLTLLSAGFPKTAGRSSFQGMPRRTAASPARRATHSPSRWEAACWTARRSDRATHTRQGRKRFSRGAKRPTRWSVSAGRPPLSRIPRRGTP